MKPLACSSLSPLPYLNQLSEVAPIISDIQIPNQWQEMPSLLAKLVFLIYTNNTVCVLFLCEKASVNGHRKAWIWESGEFDPGSNIY